MAPLTLPLSTDLKTACSGRTIQIVHTKIVSPPVLKPKSVLENQIVIKLK